MRVKTRQTLAALLALVMLLALAPMGFADVDGEEVDPTNSAQSEFETIFNAPNTVTVDLAKTNDNMNGDDETKPYDLTKANVVVDLYKIAGVTKDPKFATYSFIFTDMTAFGDDLVNRFKAAVTAENKEQVDWDSADKAFASLGDEISEVVLKDIKSDSPTFKVPEEITTATADGKITLSNVPAGLYLMVPHGLDDVLKTAKDYIVEKEQADSEKSLLRTIAQDDIWQYVFRPQLLSLPGKTMDKDTSSYEVQQYNTAYGEWTNSITVVLKPAPEARNGDLTITKNMQNIELVEGETFKPIMFVFTVTIPGEKENDPPLYSNVTSIEITNETEVTKSVTLKDLPAGKTATIEESYSGPDYEPSEGETKIKTVDIIAHGKIGEDGKPIIASVEFTNKYNGNGKDGSGIMNDFTYVETTGEDGTKTGSWQSEQLKEVEQASNGQAAEETK